MNHFESAFKGKNSFWRYAVMIAAVFLAANTIGAIPLFIGYGIKAMNDPEALSRLASDPGNLTSLGFDQNISFFMLVFPFVAGLIAFFLLIRPLHGRTIVETINGRGSVRWGRMIVSALVWVILSALYLLVYQGIDPGNFSLNNTGTSLFWLILLSLLLVPFQASLEEILFRGYLNQGLAVLTRSALLPVVITSVLFGVMHSWNPEIKEFGFWTMIPQYVFFGLLFGVATVLDDGTEIAIGAHAGNNVFLSIMVTHSSSVLQTPAVYEQLRIEPWTEFIALVVCSLIFLAVMKTIYGWRNLSGLWRKVMPPDQSAGIL